MFEKLSKSISYIIKLLIYFIFLLIFCELTANLTIKVYKKIQRGGIDFALMDSAIMRELEKVQSGADLNLYRWYSNQANFKGKHIITDGSGFRINSNAINENEIIGMFGGSTTFSVLTDQSNTIPNLISKLIKNKQVLNFGVGGYSTGAEIMTFVEALRAYPEMKKAIFYDGVNELELGVSRLNEKKILKTYNLIGAPYIDGELTATKNNLLFGYSLNHSSLYYIYKRILSKFHQNKKFLYPEKIIKEIVARYYNNIKVINAICKDYKIDCIFSWQPTIYTLSETSMSEREFKIKKETPRSDYNKLTKMIFSDERSKYFKIIDLTNALDEKSSSKQFYHDWCHLNKEGNLLIANAFLKILVDDQ